MEQNGIAIGIALLAMVTTVAFALGAKATRSVEQFRDEHHEHFTGRRGE